ncbi:MAG: gamma-glutamyl-gamma-aminobutyrate hydrolase family protein [Deltaproteobacteria bacterium]|nr:gamma-glutamyl-gamma-aminobutyrate hydrolase family protein [Deltaproteobacteria bacterium]MBW2070806.1 gamma-glutamyl-gamma-aminobutyrate hydrolase family protein [Deltaproteobacteria bacterium]
MLPLIGITCSRLVGGAWGLYSRGHFMDYTFAEYSEAVHSCGGAPMLIPAVHGQDSLESIISRLDGLILSGGPDVHPRFYGEQPLKGLGDVDEELDLMELAVARMAVEKDLPLLAICRGIQVLNVALGGTLYQDIGRQVRRSINHSQQADKGVNTHTVHLEKDTLLHRLIGEEVIWVNGRHHQAIKDLAEELRVSARAPDGVIECVEHRSRAFVLGVQWHPEGTWKSDPHSKKFFRALAAASREIL